jgi:hypothetical protein
MPKIPDIKNLSPDRWLSRMQGVRQELLADFTDALAAHDEPEAAAEALAELFDDYGWEGEGGEHKAMLDVRAEAGELVFWHESGEEELRVEPSDGGWTAETDHESLRDLAIEALKLIPWWTEGAFAASVGTPQAFVDEEDS